MASIVTDVMWIQKLLAELHIVTTRTPIVFCDNISKCYLAKNPILHSRTKYVDIGLHFIRERVMKGVTGVEYHD